MVQYQYAQMEWAARIAQMQQQPEDKKPTNAVAGTEGESNAAE